MTLTFGSLFAGIGGFDLGFERAGLVCAWQVERDAHCNRVLAKWWPNVQRFEDVETAYGISRQREQHPGVVAGSGDASASERRQRQPASPGAGDDRPNEKQHVLTDVDVLCGGFPCQDVSVAGRRAGLAGERSGLWFEFHRLVAEISPRWVVIENVPGLLSSCGCPECKTETTDEEDDEHAVARWTRPDHRGRDFATILQGLDELGYGVAWRMLDAQHFGVPQRRRRIFIVGCRGHASAAAAVLFEPESCERHPAPRPASRERTPTVAQTGAGDDGDSDVAGTLLAPAGGMRSTDIDGGAYVLGTSGASQWREGVSLVASDDNGTNAVVVAADLFNGETGDVAQTIAAGTHGPNNSTPHVIYALRSDAAREGKAKTPSPDAEGRVRLRDPGFSVKEELSPTLEASGPHTILAGNTLTTLSVEGTNAGVVGALTAARGRRRMTGPDEATAGHLIATTHALTSEGADASEDGTGRGVPLVQTYQAVREGMTVRRLIPTECERLQGFPDEWTADLSDSARYRCLGNAVAVPVAEWIGRRLLLITEELGQ